MRNRQFHVVLTTEQEEKLRTIGFDEARNHPFRAVLAARALLKAAAGQGDREIAEALDKSVSGVALLRKRFATEGLEACLTHRPQENRFRKVTGDVEARILQIACSQPPEGRCRWTLRLLTDRVIELGIVESLSDEGLRQVLKKTKLSLTSSNAS